MKFLYFDLWNTPNSGNYAPFRKKSKLYNNKVYKIVSSGRDDFGCFTKDIIAYLQLKYLIKPSEISSSVLFSSIYYRKSACHIWS